VSRIDLRVSLDLPDGIWQCTDSFLPGVREFCRGYPRAVLFDMIVGSRCMCTAPWHSKAVKRNAFRCRTRTVFALKL